MGFEITCEDGRKRPFAAQPILPGNSMKRLYLQFYLTIVASLVLVVVTAGALWRFAVEATPVSQAFAMAGELVAVALAAPDAPRDAQQRALTRIAEKLHTDAALFGA